MVGCSWVSPLSLLYAPSFASGARDFIVRCLGDILQVGLTATAVRSNPKLSGNPTHPFISPTPFFKTVV